MILGGEPWRISMKMDSVIVEKAFVAKDIEEYEKDRADSNNTGGSGSANTGGTVAPDVHGFGLKRWFEKMEQVFEICKCAEDDKVKFVVCTFEGRALTWQTEIKRWSKILDFELLKGDDIEAYNYSLLELCFDVSVLVSTDTKRLKELHSGFPEGNQRKCYFFKALRLCMRQSTWLREMIEQGGSAKALRIGDSN
ncbi:hypothetical protein Tco_0422471 [Tanacetum coccineum]